MKIILQAKPQEITDLVLILQGQQLKKTLKIQKKENQEQVDWKGKLFKSFVHDTYTEVLREAIEKYGISSKVRRKTAAPEAKIQEQPQERNLLEYSANREEIRNAIQWAKEKRVEIKKMSDC